MVWHQTFAYLLLAVLLTRLSWGLYGSDTARLRPLLRAPRDVLHYLRHWHRLKRPSPGHNPAGGYMVLLLWGLLLAQLSTGLFATDDILTEGPLYHWVGEDTAAGLTTLHHRLFTGIQLAVALHILALLAYRLKGVALVPAMITGKHRGLQGRMTLRRPWPALATFLALIGLLGWGAIWPLW